VIILDQTNLELESYPGVYQNHLKDIYKALLKGKTRFDEYQKLIMIFPVYREPLGMKEGFLNFFIDFGFYCGLIAEFGNREIQEVEVYYYY
jgi:hypothetical protein